MRSAPVLLLLLALAAPSFNVAAAQRACDEPPHLIMTMDIDELPTVGGDIVGELHAGDTTQVVTGTSCPTRAYRVHLGPGEVLTFRVASDAAVQVSAYARLSTELPTWGLTSQSVREGMVLSVTHSGSRDGILAITALNGSSGRYRICTAISDDAVSLECEAPKLSHFGLFSLAVGATIGNGKVTQSGGASVTEAVSTGYLHAFLGPVFFEFAQGSFKPKGARDSYTTTGYGPGIRLMGGNDERRVKAFAEASFGPRTRDVPGSSSSSLTGLGGSAAAGISLYVHPNVALDLGGAYQMDRYTTQTSSTFGQGDTDLPHPITASAIGGRIALLFTF